MIELVGKHYDGGWSRGTPVTLQLFDDGELHVEGPELSLRLSARALRISERIGRAPRRLDLGGGGYIELPDSEELEMWLQIQRGGRAGWVVALQRRWLAVATSLAVTLGIAFATVQLGIPALATLVARMLPPSVDEQLGAGALEALDESTFAPSALPEEREREVSALFERLEALAQLGRDARLELRAGGELGANAFALPSGIVVVTDELVALAADDAELAAVLAHELGHVGHRHSLRAALQGVGIGVLIGAALGDFASDSSLVLPATLVQLQYSRRFELEADAFSQDLLARTELNPQALGRMLERLEHAHAGASLPAYLSSHPATEERVRALRERR